MVSVSAAIHTSPDTAFRGLPLPQPMPHDRDQLARNNCSIFNLPISMPHTAAFRHSAAIFHFNI